MDAMDLTGHVKNGVDTAMSTKNYSTREAKTKSYPQPSTGGNGSIESPINQSVSDGLMPNKPPSRRK